MFAIEYVRSVAEDVGNLRAVDRKRIFDRIEQQLSRAPTKPTRNRKMLIGLVPPWEHEGSTWELRVGEYRVFYEVEEDNKIVTVRAIRHKPPHKSLEDVI